MDPSTLSALSPVDGRYAAAAAPLRNYFSEAALIRERVRVEALWFLALCDPALRLLAHAPAEAVLARTQALAREPPADVAEVIKRIEAVIEPFQHG